MIVFFTYMYFGHMHVNAQQIYTRNIYYANVISPLISRIIGSKNQISKNTLIINSHFRTNTALRIKLYEHYIFTKILIFSYNNVQTHPNIT